ncbi:MAG: mechanosensitive ion channel family protein [Pseudomonadota bacterium]
MFEWFESIWTSMGFRPWTLQVFLVVFGALILDVVYRKFVNRMATLAERTSNYWDNALVYAGKRPISMLIYGEALLLAARLIQPHTPVVLFSIDILTIAQQLLLVVIVTWFAYRLAYGFERAWISNRREAHRDFDRTTVSVLGRIVRIAIVITGLLTILSILDIPISGMLAAGGVGGIAIGLAARDLLANFFGGLMVFLDRPFSVGDWVRSPDRDIEGVVEKIGWRMTTIIKFDRRPMYVPNSVFTTVTVENPSRMTHRRINEHVGIRYDDFDQVKPIVDGVRSMLEQHDAIATDQTMIVRFNHFGQSSLDILVHCFTKTTVWDEYHRAREDILIQIGLIIEQHGAQIAFPTQTLKLDTSNPEPAIRADEISRATL